jgi:AcrR family transcriptional regulator
MGPVGIAERKERQRAELRDQILAAALRIIRTDGFDALTMRKIAEAIEYSPAALYLYFASRDEIAVALVRDGFGTLVRDMAPAAAIADPLERLHAIGRAYIGFAQREPETYRLMFMEDARYTAPLFDALKHSDDDTGEAAFSFLRDTVQQLIDQGTFCPDPADVVAGLLWAGLHGIAALKITCETYPFDGSIDGPAEMMIAALARGFACS